MLFKFENIMYMSQSPFGFGADSHMGDPRGGAGQPWAGMSQSPFGFGADSHWLENMVNISAKTLCLNRLSALVLILTVWSF